MLDLDSLSGRGGVHHDHGYVLATLTDPGENRFGVRGLVTAFSFA